MRPGKRLIMYDMGAVYYRWATTLRGCRNWAYAGFWTRSIGLFTTYHDNEVRKLFADL